MEILSKTVTRNGYYVPRDIVVDSVDKILSLPYTLLIPGDRAFAKNVMRTFSWTGTAWVDLNTNAYVLPYDAANKQYTADFGFNELGRSQFMFVFKTYGGDGDEPIVIVDSKGEPYHCQDKLARRVYNKHLPWNGDGEHSVYAQFTNSYYESNGTPVPGIITLDLFNDNSATVFASEDGAKSGNDGLAAMSPYLTRIAMSQFGYWKGARTYSDTTEIQSFDQLTSSGRYIIDYGYGAILENRPTDWNLTVDVIADDHGNRVTQMAHDHTGKMWVRNRMWNNDAGGFTWDANRDGYLRDSEIGKTLVPMPHWSDTPELGCFKNVGLNGATSYTFEGDASMKWLFFFACKHNTTGEFITVSGTDPGGSTIDFTTYIAPEWSGNSGWVWRIQ